MSDITQPVEAPASAPRMTGQNKPAQTYEQRMEQNARETRIAVQVIAWVVCIAAVLALIGGVIEAAQLHHFLAVLASPAA